MSVSVNIRAKMAYHSMWHIGRQQGIVSLRFAIEIDINVCDVR